MRRVLHEEHDLLIVENEKPYQQSVRDKLSFIVRSYWAGEKKPQLQHPHNDIKSKVLMLPSLLLPRQPILITGGLTLCWLVWRQTLLACLLPVSRTKFGQILTPANSKGKTCCRSKWKLCLRTPLILLRRKRATLRCLQRDFREASLSFSRSSSVLTLTISSLHLTKVHSLDPYLP